VEHHPISRILTAKEYRPLSPIHGLRGTRPSLDVGCGGGRRDGVFPVGQTDPATESRRQAGWMCPPGSVAKKETSYRDNIEMIIEELLLKGSVITFNDTVYLGTVGIGEQVRDAVFTKGLIKLSQVFRAVVTLPVFDMNGVQGFEPHIKVFHVFTVKPLIVKGKGKFQFCINGIVEIVFDSIL
jgi:hypothetical protein